MATKKEKLFFLETQYAEQKKEIKDYLLDAILSDNDNTIAELKEEMADIEAQYQTDREQIERKG